MASEVRHRLGRFRASALCLARLRGRIIVPQGILREDLCRKDGRRDKETGRPNNCMNTDHKSLIP
jgi:hypothetical protein